MAEYGYRIGLQTIYSGRPYCRRTYADFDGIIHTETMLYKGGAFWIRDEWTEGSLDPFDLHPERNPIIPKHHREWRDISKEEAFHCDFGWPRDGQVIEILE